MKIKISFAIGVLITSLFLHSTTIANRYDATNGWEFIAGLGFGNIDNMLDNDGLTAFKRIGAGKQIFYKYNALWGLELGAQDGNQMRLNLSYDEKMALGDTAVQTYISPAIDLLAQVKKRVSGGKKPTIAYLKAGIAYRSLHFDRDTINSLQKINPEVQVGFGKLLSDHAMLSLGYQGIFANNIGLTVYSDGTARVKNIPTQHGGLLAFTYFV